ncbi:MAG: hypothetical protein ISS28_06435 [Candidatus Cloacimonetes bacterium]|nr:hypothetical protein [Candidatus Cloacimonadota bacterium]
MWKFKQIEIGDPERDPHEAEFFNRLSDYNEAIVREVIQNSLDAKLEPNEIVKVVFKISNVERSKFEKYLADLHPHLSACDIEIEENEIAKILIIEDLGTTGLDGKNIENGIRPSSRSNFYDFWWCEGKSYKTGKEGGRWGLGKTTFHKASKIGSFWGLTIRSDDEKELLMGKALLKTHRIENKVYNYAGYFVSDDMYNPINKIDKLEEFKSFFGLKRKDGEYGLSLIIPLPFEDINSDSIIKSTIIHYFYAILNELLIVEVIDKESNTKYRLDSDNLINISLKMDWADTIWKDYNVKEFLSFTNSSIKTKTINNINIDDLYNPKLSEDCLGDNLSNLKNNFNTGELLAFTIPIVLKKKNQRKEHSYFNIYIQKDRNIERSEEFYVRSGIIISDIKLLGNRSVRGLLVAEDKTITNFLGDSETPAHTEWNERTEGFRQKHDYAVRFLRFIRNSMKDLVSLLDFAPKNVQEDFLKNVFSIQRERMMQKDGREGSGKQPPEGIERKKIYYYVNKSKTGFMLKNKTGVNKKDYQIKIVVAYDVPSGNPFKQYHPFDFNLSAKEFKIKKKGCKVLLIENNIYIIEIKKNQFEFSVNGFDPNRDIIVKIEEVKNDSTI